MSVIASQIIGVWILYSTVCAGANQRKHQSSASLAFVRGINRWPMKSPHKGPVTRKLFPFDDVIMNHTISNDLSINYHIMRKVCSGEILLCTNDLNESIWAVVPLLIERYSHGVIDTPNKKWVWFQHHLLGASETMSRKYSICNMSSRHLNLQSAWRMFMVWFGVYLSILFPHQRGSVNIRITAMCESSLVYR